MRLIDADELKKQYEIPNFHHGFAITRMIDEAPTVEQEPPKAERVNPTARDMIEAEMKHNVEADVLYLIGLKFAIECLDKPMEPMVKTKELQTWAEKAIHDIPENACEWDKGFKRAMKMLIAKLEGKQ